MAEEGKSMASALGTAALTLEDKRQKVFAHMLQSAGEQVPILRQPSTEPDLLVDVRWDGAGYGKEHDPQYIQALEKWAEQLGAQVTVLKIRGLEDVVLAAEGFSNPFERVIAITSFGQSTSCIVDAARGMSAKGVKKPIIGAGAYHVKYITEDLKALGYSVRTFPNLALLVNQEISGVIVKSAERYSTLFVALPQ